MKRIGSGVRRRGAEILKRPLCARGIVPVEQVFAERGDIASVFGQRHGTAHGGGQNVTLGPPQRLKAQRRHERRVAASQAVQDYIAEQAYVIPLFEEPQVYGTATSVHGVAFESVGRPTFSGVWLAEH